MRGGIPISARIMALASAIGFVQSRGGAPTPAQVSAAKMLDNRQRFNSPGTEQRKRRRRNRAKLGGRRR